MAWGSNGEGQTDVPAGLADVVQVDAGGNHTLALHRAPGAPSPTVLVAATPPAGPVARDGPAQFLVGIQDADGLPVGPARLAVRVTAGDRALVHEAVIEGFAGGAYDVPVPEGASPSDVLTATFRATAPGRPYALSASAPVTVGAAVSAEAEAGQPAAFALSGAYPRAARVSVDLPEVSVEVYDVTGRRGGTWEASLPAGRAQGVAVGGLSAGVYLYRVVTRARSGGAHQGSGRITVVQ